MAERDKTMRAGETFASEHRLEQRRTEGRRLASASKGQRRREDPEMEDHLLFTFRSIIDTALVELRKEELSKGFTKIEEAISILASIAPKNTESFFTEFLQVVEKLNAGAIWFMEQKQFERASDVLERTYELVKKQPYIFLECFLAVRNNQACLWRSLGKIHKGLTYLKKAEKMLEQNKDVFSGVTYLNLAVIYNQVGE